MVTGCSITADTIPNEKGHGKSFVLRVDRDARGSRSALSPANAQATPEPTRIDVGDLSNISGVATAALGVPALIDGLQRDLVIFGLGFLGLAAVGTSLMLRARAQGRDAAPVFAAGFARAGASNRVVFVPMSAPSRAAGAQQRRCSCDAQISARSRSGRCRRCTHVARARASDAIAMPAMLTAAPADDVETVDSARVVLTESRIGQQRSYYTLKSCP